MSFTSRYSPLCDEFFISFKFTPHFDSSTKIFIRPSFESVNKNFRGSFGTGCPVGTQKEITSNLECVLKIPRNTIIDRIELRFEDTAGSFDLGDIQLGQDKISLNSVATEDSDLKVGDSLTDIEQ